jgi:hypothetical protein
MKNILNFDDIAETCCSYHELLTKILPTAVSKYNKKYNTNLNFKECISRNMFYLDENEIYYEFFIILGNDFQITLTKEDFL